MTTSNLEFKNKKQLRAVLEITRAPESTKFEEVVYPQIWYPPFGEIEHP